MMKRPMFFRVISLLMVMLLVLSGMAIAEGVQTADVEFAATETDDNIVKLTLTVKNATFSGMQLAIRYDNDVLVPAKSDGEPAEVFGDFAKRAEDALFFNTAGVTFEKEKGLVTFALYIIPGEEAEGVNAAGEYTADQDGIKLYDFYFKKISDKDYSFEIAIKDDNKPYLKAVEEGVIILNHTEQLNAKVTFLYANKEPQQTVVAPDVPDVLDSNKEKEPEFTAKDRKKDVICFKIGRNLSFAHGKKKTIDPENPLVVPYIKNDRTLVPLRFIAETLGAEVLWEEGWDGCIIKKDGTEIKITFGSADFTVNGEKFTYEAPIEVVHDRTMVPVRFVSEALGQDVYWNELNEAVVIAPADNPWIADRAAETTALNEMLVTILGILS